MNNLALIDCQFIFNFPFASYFHLAYFVVVPMWFRVIDEIS